LTKKKQKKKKACSRGGDAKNQEENGISAEG
jgi:hypothetical protein